MVDVRRTIETAFDQASGWAFGKYPSSMEENTLYINIQYPAKIVHSDSKPDEKIYDFRKPNLISIRRCGQNPANILMSKDVFIDPEDKQEKASYRLSVRNAGETFQAVETPDAEIFTQGDVGVLLDIMQDQDFQSYITFIPKKSFISKDIFLPKWNLDKMMERARPSTRD